MATTDLFNTYDLMLLADPGTDRAVVLQVLNAAPDIRPDEALEDRFWLSGDAEAQINIGTKDPVESVHVMFSREDTALMERVARRALTLADSLEMRVEDVQWGHEVTTDSVPDLRRYWNDLQRRETPAPPTKPWWKLW